MTPEQKRRQLVLMQQQQSAAPQADMSLAGRLKDNFLGVDDGVQSTGETAAAMLNRAGEVMTGGLIGDEAGAGVDAALGRGTYDERLGFYRGQQEDLRNNNPGLSLGAEVAGAGVGLLVPGGMVARSGGLAKRMAGSAIMGAGAGGIHGFMEGEGGLENRVQSGASAGSVGGAVGAAIPVGGAGIEKMINSYLGRRAIKGAAANAPTTDQLRAAGQKAYQEVDDLGVQIKPEAFNRLGADVQSSMVQNGLDQLPGPAGLSPKAARVSQVVDEMGEQMGREPTAALPFSSLDQLRKKAGVAAADRGNRLDAALGTQTVGKIDEFVSKLSPDDVLEGDAAALGPAINKARDLWSKMSKSQTIDNAIEAGQDYLSGSSSGIRNQFRRILRSDKLSRGFSDAEKAAMRRVINGSIPERMLNLAGGGLGQLLQVGGGAGLGGLPGAAIGATTAAVSRKASEAITEKNAEMVRAIIANGGMKALPKANPAIRGSTEQVLRRIVAGDATNTR